MLTRHLAVASLVLALSPAFAVARPEAPKGDDDPVAAYKAYVGAISAGKVDDVVKLVEPVPADLAPLVRASAESLVAVEAVKNGMTDRLGPPVIGGEGWNMGQLPDEILRTLKSNEDGPDVALILGVDPESKSEFPAGAMVRRDGKWLVAAWQVLDLEPGAPVQIEDAKERENRAKLTAAMVEAAKATLARLEAGEFKDAASVQTALGEEWVRRAAAAGGGGAAQGEIDEGE